MDPSELLDGIAGQVQTDYDREQRLLTYAQWLELFLQSPYRLARSAPQYALDMLDHYGTREVPSPAGTTERFRVFDLEFLGGDGRVHGQEVVQHRIHRLLRTMAEEGRSDKLILLHGPNGSGKSVIVEALYHGLEHYSHLPEGPLYRFNWVFPKSHSPEEPLGFGRPAPIEEDASSFAMLDGEEVSARLLCELRDHPLFLIPREERARIVEQALEAHPEDRRHSFRWVLEGDLCQKCNGIHEGLLAGYRGDWRRMLRHVQVERFYVSRRFRNAAVTIHPVASVDAQVQQVTADLSVQNLPPVLQNLKIFEPFGDLVDANGGIVEFADFLKRPMDYNKYLLNAVEKGNISLPNSLIHLNLVMMGTSNEKHLDAFKSTPDFTSFKGRIELVPVPYLLSDSVEAELYRDMLRAVRQEVHAAPHTFELAALFAVLTRLIPADREDLGGDLGQLARGLSPLEKARLYARREAPDRLDRTSRQVLLAGAGRIRRQYEDNVIYEGRFGASAREMRMVLSLAAYDRGADCLTPPLLFRRLKDLIRDKTVYDFLKIDPKDGYHDPEAFIEVVSALHSELVLGEIQDAMELIREEEYDRRFDEYFQHVTASIRGEKVRNPQSGAYEPPNRDVLKAVEDLVDTGDSVAAFRNNLVGRIGAFAVDHPSEKLDFRTLFPDLLRAVKRDFFEKRDSQVRAVLDSLLLVGREEFGGLDTAARKVAETTMANLQGRFGYCPSCAREAAAWLTAHYPS